MADLANSGNENLPQSHGQNFKVSSYNLTNIYNVTFLQDKSQWEVGYNGNMISY